MATTFKYETGEIDTHEGVWLTGDFLLDVETDDDGASFKLVDVISMKRQVTGTLRTVVNEWFEGDQEDTTIVLPHDSTGSKNAVQAVGSSTSYGKRYTAGLLLNLTSRGEDDDGKAADAPATITQDQVIILRELIEATDSDKARFLKHIKVDDLSDIRADKFDFALGLLKQKEQRRG